MKAKLIAFGEIEIEGERYDHDIVIEAGNVRKRAKKVSKIFRGQFGHTPLSVEEAIPWGEKQLTSAMRLSSDTSLRHPPYFRVLLLDRG